MRSCAECAAWSRHRGGSSARPLLCVVTRKRPGYPRCTSLIGNAERGDVMSGRPRVLLTAAGRGALAGLAGAAVMTAGEKVEQALTSRPNSYVPARTLLTLLEAARQADDEQSRSAGHHLMHYADSGPRSESPCVGVWARPACAARVLTWPTTPPLPARLRPDHRERAPASGAATTTWSRGRRRLSRVELQERLLGADRVNADNRLVNRQPGVRVAVQAGHLEGPTTSLRGCTGRRVG
jgi:hypothetical protein